MNLKRKSLVFRKIINKTEATHSGRVWSLTSHRRGVRHTNPQEIAMAIKGLKELLERHGKEQLTAEGFEEELNKLLPETHIPKNVYNELNEKYKLLDRQKKDVDALLSEAKKGLEDSQEFRSKYDALVAQQKADGERYEKTIADMKKGYAIDSALTAAGARNAKAVRALLDEGKITLQEDGSCTGIKEQLESIRKDNDFLFSPSDNNAGNGKPSFGNGGGGSNPPSDSLAQNIAQAMGL